MHVWNVRYAARCKYRTQKSRQKSPSGHHRTTLSGYIFAIKAHIDNRKKNLLSSNISATCPHNMVNFGPLAAEIVSLVWGASGNFNGFRVLATLLQRRRSTEVNQTLHYVWPSPGLVRYILAVYYVCNWYCNLLIVTNMEHHHWRLSSSLQQHFPPVTMNFDLWPWTSHLT